MTVRLEQLLAAATPGPWRVGGYEIFAGGRVIGKTTEAMLVQDAALIALAPDMARLLIDMGEALREIVPEEDTVVVIPVPRRREVRELLARLDALGKDTA